MIRMARSVTVIPARNRQRETGRRAVQEKKIRVAAYCPCFHGSGRPAPQL